MRPFFLLTYILLLVLVPNIIPTTTTTALPLTTNSRWIIDESGRRVKLSCLNWVSHLKPIVAEGLSLQPLDVITSRIASMGFNCVRLTWPLYLATNHTLASATVKESLKMLRLDETVDGFEINNPAMLHLSLIDAYQAVVSSLGDKNVMVILDNHLSKPGWCCSYSDGNGFFGDQFFNPDLWLKGLTRMATLFKGTPNVVGMSLRNELRGPKQNLNDWYRYMQKGAEAVHAANRDVLVILSGLDYDTDLSFLRNKQVTLSFTRKLVFELHWYGFSDGNAWVSGNANQVCGSVMSSVMRRGGFLLGKGWPLFVSEWGGDERGVNVNDNRYLNCFVGLAAELDFDWALWTLVGSYYLRQGVTGMEEFYGVLDSDWRDTRNSSFFQRISALQSPFRGPGLSQQRPHKIIFHPVTGLCVLRESLLKPLKLGPCAESEAWSYTPQKTLMMKGTYFCIEGEELGEPAKLSLICTSSSSKWEAISDSKMHFSTKLPSGRTGCLDVDSSNRIIVNACKCLSSDNACDPGSQWFRLVDSTRSSTPIESILEIPEKDSYRSPGSRAST